MTNPGTRWTAVLLAASAGLTLATILLHAGMTEERPVVRASAARAIDDAAPPRQEVSATPSSPAPVTGVPPIAPTGPLSVERRRARDEGYREAREASWEGTLAGQVLSSEGPIANLTVRVEWVLALQPDRDEIARLKRAGAHRDHDGAWWARALAQTDESGCFLFEGLPAVPLRLHAGSATQQVQLGSFAQIRTERP
jgi:hypothetical protein